MDNSKAHEEFLAQWNVSVEDIREYKRNQWLITHYGILGQIGLILFINKILLERIYPVAIIPYNTKVIFSLLSITIFIISLIFIIHYQKAQQTCRKVIVNMEYHFSSDFKNEKSVTIKVDKNKYLSFWFNFHLLIIQIFALVVTMIITIWFTFKIG